MLDDGLAVLGTGDCGGVTTGVPASTRKTAMAQEMEVVDILSGGGVGSRWLICGFQWLVGLHGSFFFFGGLWVVGSVIRSRHEWWSPAWEASLASLLAWG